MTDSRQIFDHYSARELLLRVVRHLVKRRRKRNPPPAWSVLMYPFGLGSTSASKLCLAAGLDPDSGGPLENSGKEDEPRTAIELNNFPIEFEGRRWLATGRLMAKEAP